MLFLFLAFAIAVAAWFAVLKLAFRAQDREETRARDEVRAAVREEIGLEIDGDPIGACAMRGTVHDVALTVEVQATRSLPGPSDVSHVATAIGAGVPLPDLVVCRRSDVDSVMGPIPAVAPQPTGVPAFDATYAMFVGVGASPHHPAGYRDAGAPSPALAWVDPKTLADLGAQRLIFMRVRDGRCDLAFDPTSADGVGPLVATAANVVRRATGRPLVAPAPKRTIVTPALSYGRVTGVMSVALGSILLTPLGATVAFFAPIRELNGEAACGKGGEIFVSASTDGEGTSYGLYCSNDHEASLALHYVSAVALYFAVIFAAATVVGLLRWPTWRPRA
ncbi:MAG: hypothetical protein KF819_23260 [Labilithrix sp.]|nr:hypothetical protein [Labilithrix sp.]